MPPVSYQTIKLSKGKHASPEDGACVMELASTALALIDELLAIGTTEEPAPRPPHPQRALHRDAIV
jgi:hypothetical protein